MSRKRTLRILLESGHPQGPRVASIARWEGIAVLACRSDLKDLLQRPELERGGIVVLRDASKESRQVLVDGTKESMRSLSTKYAQDHWWNEAMVLSTGGEPPLTSNESRFIATRLTSKVRRVGMARLRPASTHRIPRLTETQRTRVANYIHGLETLLPFLQVEEFTNYGPPVTASDGTRKEVFELAVRANSPETAWAVDGDDGFTVLKGSNASVGWEVTHKTKTGWRRRRDQLELDGTLRREGHRCRFTRSVQFRSAGEAAQVICGAPRSGLDYWRREDDQLTYREWKARDSNE